MTTLLKQKRISAVELCELCLARIEKTKNLNHFISVYPKLSRNLAKLAQQRTDNGEHVGPLNGIPVAIKDNFCTESMQTSCGSRMLHGFVPPYTATVVQKLQDQGAVVLGKTNLDEFAMGCGTTDSYYGPTRNPWKYKFKEKHSASKGHRSPGNPDPNMQVLNNNLDKDWYIAGGSSGGSAVAVATGSVFCALGSDTGGSTRNPASLCGVVGLKPTYGTVSRHGLIPLVNSMDVPGILTRSVDDAAIMYNVISGRDELDSTTVNRKLQPLRLPEEISVKGLNIGIPKEYHVPGLSTDTKSIWQKVADMFADAGANVHQVSLPHTQLSIVCYHILNCCEVASNMARYDGIEYGHRAANISSTEALYAQTRHEAFNDVVRSRILAGNYFLLKENYEKYFMQALKIRRLIAEDFVKVYNGGVDMLLTPTVLADAPHYSWFSEADNRTRTQEQDVCTQSVNMAGVPAITVPTTLSSRGLPIGLQLIGQTYQEQTLLSAAKWLEQHMSFPMLDISHLDDLSTEQIECTGVL